MGDRVEEIEKELVPLKKEIEEAKTEKAQLAGRKEELLTRLRGEFNVKGLDAARTKIKELETKRDSLVVKIKRDFGKLREGYKW